MKTKGQSSKNLEFLSLEDKDLEKIHKYQNEKLRDELSSFLDFEQPWAPMALGHIKAKIDEIRKEDRTALFGIWSKDNKFVGLSYYSEGWDTWEPNFYVIIWPEYRKKGLGSEAVKLILDFAFDQGIAHVISCYIPEWNEVGIKFIESLGFKRAGVMRRIGIKDGKFYDGVFFDILRDERLALRAQEGDQ